MWECKECGQENDDSFAHCMSCGVESGTEPTESALQPVPGPAPKRAEPRSEWELTRTVARVVSFFGWATICLGVFLVPLAYLLSAPDRTVHWAAIFGMVINLAQVCGLGLVLVLFGHVARAVVDIRESKRP